MSVNNCRKDTLILAFSTFYDAQIGRVVPFSAPPLGPLSSFHAGMIWCVALLVAFLNIKRAAFSAKCKRLGF